ncbi:MAG: hypothetical protein R3330_02800, partial [Saprospiraceae bacterium]|nr:hypothetical protein [Saprospiraceae bacterium]
MRSLIAICLLLSHFVQLNAQCGCVNCPVPIISNQTTNGTINISGAVNDQLGINGQRLCQVCVHFVHDAPDELDFFLISPSGSQVQLIENTGLSVNDNITFDICFLTCDQTAEPDPGFPPVFDSGAGWQVNQTYTGTYYPFDPACLESLSGDVNGTWTLQMTDQVFADDGTLLDWYLVFEDDTGIGCPNAGDCSPTCLADAGVVSVPPDTFCVGDPALSSSGYVPFYDGVTNVEPPVADYGYTFVVALTDLDAPIIEFSPDPDLTGYPPGTYAICGYSYLLADEPLIPTPDGIVTLDDLETQIANGDICADKMNICFIRTIAPQVPVPDLTGPLQVCEGESVQYVLQNNDPAYLVEWQVTSGSLGGFTINGDTANIIWNSGPGTLCVELETACGLEQSCIVVDVFADPALSILGNFDVCGGEIESYTVTPPPGPGESYVFSVPTGGTIVSEGSDQFTVEWTTTQNFGQLCAELFTVDCGSQFFCVLIDIDNESLLPPAINTPLEVCLGDEAIASIPFDPGILDYTWTASGLTIESGQGTNTITFSGAVGGVGTLCVEAIGNCGLQGPLCEDILLTESPNPVIDPVDPSCDLTLPVSVTLSGGGSGLWSQTSGPPGITFADPGAISTSATFPQSGIYTIQFSETVGICSGSDEITVEILPELVLSPVIFDCDLNQAYTVSFEILSGQPPYTVNGTTVPGTLFTSGTYASGTTYTFLIEDAL